MNNELDQVVEDGSMFIFGGRYSFEKTAPTAFISAQGTGKPYELQSLLLFIKSGDNIREYTKAVREKSIPQIAFPDRRELKNYLTGEIDTSVCIQASAIPDSTTDAAPAKRPRLGEGDATASAPVPDAAVEQSAIRHIISNERQLRDRNTMLSVPGRSFKGVLDILDHVIKVEEDLQAKEEARRKSERARQKEEEKKRSAGGPQPSGRYNRETAPEIGLQQMGAENLGLDQVGFGATAEAVAAGGEASALPPRPPPQQQQPEKPPQPKPRPAPPHATRSSRRAPPPTLTPVIMVPPAISAMLNMQNAKEFLEKYNYRSPEQAQADPHNRALQQEFEQKGYYSVVRQIPGMKEKVKYHITDKEPRKEADWKNVVGVFVLGKPWQFKNFPFPGAKTGDLVHTFQNICGVYLQYSDEPVDPQVKKWNVKILQVPRHGTGNNVGADAVRDFWAHLDNFMKTHPDKNFLFRK